MNETFLNLTDKISDIPLNSTLSTEKPAGQAAAMLIILVGFLAFLIYCDCKSRKEAKKNQRPNAPVQKASESPVTLENLKLIFCQVLREPVIIGSDNGVIKHFKWNRPFHSYIVSECPKCCSESLEGNPPPYHSVVSV